MYNWISGVKILKGEKNLCKKKPEIVHTVKKLLKYKNIEYIYYNIKALISKLLLVISEPLGKPQKKFFSLWPGH